MEIVTVFSFRHIFNFGIILGILSHFRIVSGGSETCCENVGCFSMAEPWVTARRQLPEPNCNVTAEFILYPRGNSLENYTIPAWPNIVIDTNVFNISKMTIMFIHDFGYSAEDDIVQRLKDAFLERVDCNVILVDWKDNSTYPQGVSNGRVIAGQISRFIKYLIYKQEASPGNFYILGHGVSAHTAGLVGKLVPGIGRITGLDPAGPLFDGDSREIQLDTRDAKFVDVIHTNCHPVTGIGTCFPLGHVDFYFNGGLLQSGCPVIQHGMKVNAMVTGDYTEFYENPDEAAFCCSHNRAIEYYITALSNQNCIYWGLTRTAWRFIFDVFSFGLFSPYVTRLQRCSLRTCSSVGLDTPRYIARGSLDVATKDYSPYCIPHNSVNQLMAEKLTNYEMETGNQWKYEATSPDSWTHEETSPDSWTHEETSPMTTMTTEN